MKWKDSRIHKPPTHSCNKFPVLYKLTDSIVSRGYATWMPTDQYTNGQWQDVTSTNGNKHGNLEVLYWHDYLDLPEDIEL